MNNFIAGLFIGGLIVLAIMSDRCRPTNVKVNTKIIHDTIFIKVPSIPEPKIYYRTKREIDTIVKYDTWVEYRTLLDSIFVDSSSQIPVNRYIDKIDQDSVQLDYTIETLGFLTKFDPKLTIKRRIEYVPYQKNWVAGIGLSDKANWKGSIGYRGWMTEIEFSDGYRFNQLYITKQFHF